MSLQIATHSGPFHADDVLAVALIRQFVQADAAVVRTRDAALLDEADIVVDVGGEYAPDRCRFDHHQHAYHGPLSSAGMVLSWLVAEAHISADLGEHLRTQLVDYVDAVDNGRITPSESVPCFSRLIDTLKMGCRTGEEFDLRFIEATIMARACVQGLTRGHAQLRASRQAVEAAMEEAEGRRSNVLVLERYHRWKPIYFANGGVDHITEYVLHPGSDGSWRISAIPPEEGSFAQKRSLPESWAGLTDEALEAVTGVSGARFCHKNRFIAVFGSVGGAVEALARAGLLIGEAPRVG